MDTAYTFTDVMFVPQYSEIESRSEVDLTSTLNFIDLKLPIISSNMADVTGSKMCNEMWKNGGFGIMHRFMSIEDNVAEFKEVNGKCGVSVGIGDSGKERFMALYDAGARIFCVDVAHGHHIHVEKMVVWIKCNFQNTTVIAGNIATKEAALDMITWGADSVKIGIGPGGLCQTRENTGVGVPQLYALEKIYALKQQFGHIGFIADGGIKKTGDIAKAIKYSDAVMLGSFLAGTTETPGHVYESMDGQYYKTISGSASAESKVKSGQKNTFIEGGIKQVPFRGHVKYILKKIRENLQSSFSYSGANNLRDFRQNSQLIKITGGGKQESKI